MDMDYKYTFKKKEYDSKKVKKAQILLLNGDFLSCMVKK